MQLKSVLVSCGSILENIRERKSQKKNKSKQQQKTTTSLCHSLFEKYQLTFILAPFHQIYFELTVVSPGAVSE